MLGKYLIHNKFNMENLHVICSINFLVALENYFPVYEINADSFSEFFMTLRHKLNLPYQVLITRLL